MPSDAVAITLQIIYQVVLTDLFKPPPPAGPLSALVQNILQSALHLFRVDPSQPQADILMMQGMVV